MQNQESKEQAELKWFYMRASYARASKAQEALKLLGIETYLPIKHKKTIIDGHHQDTTEYPLPSNIFIHCTEEEAYDVTSRSVSPRRIDYLDFTFDHTVTNRFGKNPYVIICDKDMQAFIDAASHQHPGAHIVTPEELPQEIIEQGQEVKIINGPFKGIVGKVVKLYGKKRVAVSIPDVVSYVTAYIDKSNMIPVGDDEKIK